MDERIINTLRGLSVDIINNSGIGYIGSSLSAAPLIYTVYKYHLKFLPTKPNWLNRDRFIMGSNTGSSLLYSMLFLAGYDINLKDLKKYGEYGSLLKSIPEYNTNIGIEISSNSSGTGFASALGICLGEEYLRNVVSRELFDFYTYTIVTKSDLVQGISYEAASLAGSLHLGKLIVLYDDSETDTENKVSSYNDDIINLYASLGWDTHYVDDSENIKAINDMISASKLVTDKPSIIRVKTGGFIKEFMKNDSGCLSEEETLKLKEKLSLNEIPFFIKKETAEYFRNEIYNRNISDCKNWYSIYEEALSNVAPPVKLLLETLENGKSEFNLNDFTLDYNKSLVDINKDIINYISLMNPLFLGTSNEKMPLISNSPYLKINGYGKNIQFDNRVNVMPSILNGLSTLNLRVFGLTDLINCDNMKIGMRQSAIMNRPVTYIFTNDSFMSPGNELKSIPVEELSLLRSIPNMKVFKPADANELVASWNYILNNSSVSALVLTNEKCKNLINVDSNLALKGGYILKESTLSRIDGIIVSSGYDVNIALILKERLLSRGLSVRVVSVPSIELFDKQKSSYKEKVLPDDVKTIVIESSNDYKWLKYSHNINNFINVNEYLENTKVEDLVKHTGFDLESLTDRIEALLKEK